MFRNKIIFWAAFILFIISLAALKGHALQKPQMKEGYDYTSVLKALRFRNIGPASMGGRTVDFAVVESNTSIIYAAVGPSGVWKSENNGTTWFPLMPNEGSVSVGAVAVSQSNPDIVWVGTGEGTSRNSVGIGDGVYKSEDGGKTWLKYKNGFPTIAVRDIQIHPRERDLLVGTHGLGLWILDDIRPLENLTPAVLDEDCVLFYIKPATLYSSKSSSMYSGPHDFSGPNPRFGASVTYYLKEKPRKEDKIRITVYDSTDREVNILQSSKEKGLNRIYWNLREKGLSMPSSMTGGRRFGGSFGGAYVLPGEYKVVLDFNDKRMEKAFTVRALKEHDFSLEERKINQQYVREIARFVQKGAQLLDSMNALDSQLKPLKKRLKAEKISDSDILKKLDTLLAKVNKIQEAYSYSVEGATGYRRPVKVALRGGTIPEQISRLLGEISRYQGPPTQTQIDQFNDIKETMTPLLEEESVIADKNIPELNKLLNEIGFPFLRIEK